MDHETLERLTTAAIGIAIKSAKAHGNFYHDPQIIGSVASVLLHQALERNSVQDALLDKPK